MPNGTEELLDMDPVTGAVIIAGLTTVGKPTAELLKDAVGKILSPSSEAVGQGIAVSLQEWAKRRRERAGATLLNAAAMLHEAGIEPTAVPGRLLMPILEYSSLEDDANLSRRWAALLANATASREGIQVLPGYAEVLRQLTPLEAGILDWVLMASDKKVQRDKVDGHVHTVSYAHTLSLTAVLDLLTEAFGITRAEFDLISSDLERLQLVGQNILSLTPFGRAFLCVCAPPVIHIESADVTE